MSYSRWSNSHWYTYRSVQPHGTNETRDNAIFEVCGIRSFTAKELRDNKQLCLDTIAAIDGSATPEELRELGQYMDEFVFDVDTRYGV